VKAKDLVADAKDNETLVGANANGVIAFDGSNRRTVPWESVPPAAWFKNRVIPDGALNTESLDDDLLLAVLGTELGLLRDAGRYREIALSLDKDGERADQLRSLLGD
jgi:hypothetical protein